MTDILEKCARALWKRESERAAHCDDVLGAARGQAIKPTMDPFEDHREMWIGDARAVIATLADGVTEEMVRAAIEDRATDDEGTFAPLGDLIDFSGENKTHTVVRSALSAAIRAAIPEGTTLTEDDDADLPTAEDVRGILKPEGK